MPSNTGNPACQKMYKYGATDAADANGGSVEKTPGNANAYPSMATRENKYAHVVTKIRRFPVSKKSPASRHSEMTSKQVTAVKTAGRKLTVGPITIVAIGSIAIVNAVASTEASNGARMEASFEADASIMVQFHLPNGPPLSP